MGARSTVLKAFGRTAILLAWALVGWGALLLVSALVGSLQDGPAAALARLLPARGASIWGWLGPLSVLLALAVGLCVATVVVVRRTQGTTRPDP